MGVVGLWFVLLEFEVWELLVCGLFCWSSRFGCCWFVVCFVGVRGLGVVGLWFVLLEFEVWVLLVSGLFVGVRDLGIVGL